MGLDYWIGYLRLCGFLPCSEASGRSIVEMSPRTPADVEEGLRTQLAEWHAAGAMQSPQQVDEVLGRVTSQTVMAKEGFKNSPPFWKTNNWKKQKKRKGL